MIPPSPTRIVEFDRPCPAIGSNDVRNMHWAKLRRNLEPWQQAAWAAWRNQFTRTGRLQAKPAWIQVCIPFDLQRRRDPHNYVGTVVKAVIDGLVKAGAWPDDNPSWIRTVEPVLIRGSRVIVYIYEEQDENDSGNSGGEPSSAHQGTQSRQGAT